jgi:biopolymer transport protein ExbD
MAEVNTGKKGAPHVDMTPMVDLGFLLITFFMLTTTMVKPQTMEVNMPDKTKDNKEQKIKESKALTVILGEKDKIYYYQGLENPEVKFTNYSPTGIRKLLLDKSREIDGLIVLIKPMERSRYKNMVDILDEMAITNQQRYSLVDISEADLALAQKADKDETTPTTSSPTN